MFNYKNLIIALLSLIALLCAIILIKSAFRGDSSSSSETEETSSQNIEFTFENEELPEGYVAVLGYEDVYRIVLDGQIKGYKIRLANGKYADYDIEKPVNFELVDADKQIYQVLNSDNKLLYYRHYNGKEWDFVNKNGEIILEVPANFVRADNSQEIYEYDDNGKKAYKRVKVFSDGTCAWTQFNDITQKGENDK